MVKPDRYRQRVPRPSDFRVGDLPSWAGTARLNPTVDDVAAVLDPIGSHVIRPGRFSSVLVPLVDRPEGLALTFIRRASTLSLNAGHLAFPGGRRDGNEALVTTALRETEEEVGLLASSISVLGELAPSTRASDRTNVAPFVGLLERDPPFRPNPDEVEAIFEVPIAELYADEVGWEEVWSRGGEEVRVNFFASERLFGEDLLWGLTARIVWDLLKRLAAAAAL